MKTLRRYLKIYFMIVSQFIKTRLQYRADFIVGAIGMLASNAANVIVLALVFGSIPTIKGWSYDELLFLYGFYLMALTPQQLFFDTFWDLSHQLQTGWFIKCYFRPLNMMFYYTSQYFDLKGLVMMVFGVVLLAVSGSRLRIAWSLPKILLLLANWASASLILISIIVGTMSSAFWIINANSLAGNIVTVRDFARYPLDIFNTVFKKIFTFVAPIGFIAFYPCQALLRPVAEISPAAWFSPLVGILMFGIAYQIWRKGVNSHSGTGS